MVACINDEESLVRGTDSNHLYCLFVHKSSIISCFTIIIKIIPIRKGNCLQLLNIRHFLHKTPSGVSKFHTTHCIDYREYIPYMFLL